MKYKCYVRIRKKPFSLPWSLPSRYAGRQVHPAAVVLYNRRAKAGYVVADTKDFIVTELNKKRDPDFPAVRVRGDSVVLELDLSKNLTLHTVLENWVAFI